MSIKDNREGYATLLDLTMEEYLQLRHGPLLEFKNSHGKTVSYMMHFSPANPPELLTKLGLENSFFLQFTLRQIEKLKESGVDLFPDVGPDL